jgi:hypothetical protein
MHLQAETWMHHVRSVIYCLSNASLTYFLHQRAGAEWAQHSCGDDAKKRRQQIAMQKSTTINCPGLESIHYFDEVLTIELLERKTLSLKRDAVLFTPKWADAICI